MSNGLMIINEGRWIVLHTSLSPSFPLDSLYQPFYMTITNSLSIFLYHSPLYIPSHILSNSLAPGLSFCPSPAHQFDETYQHVFFQFDHSIPFMFSMDELQETWGEDLAGKSFHVKVWVYDWAWTETQNGTATTRIIRDGIVVEVLGPKHRTFKPGFPFTAYVSLFIRR